MRILIIAEYKKIMSQVEEDNRNNRCSRKVFTSLYIHGLIGQNVGVSPFLSLKQRKWSGCHMTHSLA